MSKSSQAPYQKRILAERESLHIKLQTLKDALNKPTFLLLSHKERDLLKAQSRAMNAYLEVLDKRIRLFDPNWQVDV